MRGCLDSTPTTTPSPCITTDLNFATMILQLIASQFLAALQIPSSPSIDRGVWGALDKSTDFDLTWHETGVTREVSIDSPILLHSVLTAQYWLTIENVTLAVDGYERPVLAFNGTIPGPTIEADWGDTIRVHLKNNLKHNG